MDLFTKKTGRFVFSLIAVLSSTFLYPSISLSKDNDMDLIDKYVETKGTGIIVFDAANIKQFWIDNSVASKNGSIEIVLTKNNASSFKSVPLKIQLINVNETQDCKIEVLGDLEDVSFSVLNNKSEVVSESQKDNAFLNYSILSSVFHLENTPNTEFLVKFDSKATEIISIKKIILSFSVNMASTFLASPGKISFSDQNVTPLSSTMEMIDSNSFTLTGKQSRITSKNKILSSGNVFSFSVTVKNIGEKPTNFSVGYALYTKDRKWITGSHFPFKNNNNVLDVVRAESGSDTIIVNADKTDLIDKTDWAKGCAIALDAKKDQSDIPNANLVKGGLVEIKMMENGQFEILLDNPLVTEIKKGTKIRINGIGGSFLYTNSKRLQPGEEQTFSSSIEKDDDVLEYPSKKFPRGVYYVVPVLLSHSVNPSEENRVLISNYTVSY